MYFQQYYYNANLRIKSLNLELNSIRINDNEVNIVIDIIRVEFSKKRYLFFNIKILSIYVFRFYLLKDVDCEKYNDKTIVYKNERFFI